MKESVFQFVDDDDDDDDDDNDDDDDDDHNNDVVGEDAQRGFILIIVAPFEAHHFPVDVRTHFKTIHTHLL